MNGSKTLVQLIFDLSSSRGDGHEGADATRVRQTERGDANDRADSLSDKDKRHFLLQSPEPLVQLNDATLPKRREKCF